MLDAVLRDIARTLSQTVKARSHQAKAKIGKSALHVGLTGVSFRLLRFWRGGVGRQPKTKKGERDGSPFLFLRNRGLDQPIGVLALLAPEPEVSTRITPD
jgi:hypothetical protein